MKNDKRDYKNIKELLKMAKAAYKSNESFSDLYYYLRWDTEKQKKLFDLCYAADEDFAEAACLSSNLIANCTDCCGEYPALFVGTDEEYKEVHEGYEKDLAEGWADESDEPIHYHTFREAVEDYGDIDYLSEEFELDCDMWLKAKDQGNYIYSQQSPLECENYLEIIIKALKAEIKKGNGNKTLMEI